MRARVLLAALLCACGAPAGDAPSGDGGALTPSPRPSAVIEPRIGSGGFGYGHGAAFPGAALPHGLVKVGPDTTGPLGSLNFLHYSGYWYEDEAVRGFSHLHLHGTGATDYGVVALMPAAAFTAPSTDQDGYKLPWRKASEVATPGRYAVTLESPAGPIAVEITATTHAAYHRYRFPKGLATPTVIVNLGHHLLSGEIPEASLSVTASEVRGALRSLGGMSKGFGGYPVSFRLRSRTPWKTARTFSRDLPPADRPDASGKDVGAALTFAPAADGDTVVELQVGLSLVDAQGASASLDAELGAAPAWDFDASAAAARDAWDAALGGVRIFGADPTTQKIFYSALYRTLLMPSQHSDGDRRYRGHDGQVHQMAGRYLSDLSLWDTYRTLHPLYTVLWPETEREVLSSLYAMYREGGFFPKWPLAGGDSGSMIGQGVDLLFAEAYVKGLRDPDDAARYQALRAAALAEGTFPRGRGGRDNDDGYRARSYQPRACGSAVSQTLEWNHDDWALAQFAAALGRGDDAALFSARASGYRELYDPATGFLRGRDEQGALAAGSFDPVCQCDDYREANAWQSLFAQHDIPGVAALLGGKDAALGALDELFQRAKAEEPTRRADGRLGDASPRNYYWHGNEPDIHVPYAFSQLGRPDLAAAWAEWARATYYDDTAAGLPGNDDGGTMSAWYVFSALGFYPLPGSDRYLLGAPAFPRAELQRPDGVFVIESRGVGPLLRITLDGQPVSELRHADLRGGRTLRFERSS